MNIKKAKVKKVKYVNLKCLNENDKAFITIPVNNLGADPALIVGFLECAEVGDKFEIEIIEMSEKEFLELPKFDGF